MLIELNTVSGLPLKSLVIYLRFLLPSDLFCVSKYIKPLKINQLDCQLLYLPICPLIHTNSYPPTKFFYLLSPKLAFQTDIFCRLSGIKTRTFNIVCHKIYVRHISYS